ncbi:MAG: PKD domain-containing protein, partial [Bacteroidota bacterium]
MTRSLPWLLIPLLSLFGWQNLQAQCDATFTFNQPAPNPCTTDPVDFSANADPATVVDYAWVFMPGPGQGTSDQANPTFTFPFNGPFTVSLTVTDTAGNVCTTTQNLNLPSAPPILITADSIGKCIQNSPDTLFSPTFTIDASSMGQGPFDWDFGDGTFLNAHPNQVVNHTYDCYGTFTVTVTASGQTCPGYSQEMIFYTDPVSDLVLGGQPVFCEGDTVVAINQTDPLCNNVDYYIWDWGIFGEEYNVATEDTQVYVFDLTNQNKCVAPLQGYVDAIQLTAVNACFTHFSTTQITIRPAPVAGFQVPDTVCLPDGLAVFVNETCPTDQYFSDPTDYFWDFGDGVGTSIFRDPIYDYTTAGPGIYTVRLIAINACGADTTSREVVVVRAPIAAMIPDTNQGCAPFCMTFQNGTIPDTSEVPIHWQWNVYSDSAWSFGGGTNANSFEPIICFNAPDTFRVELIASNLCGMDTVDTLIFVQIAPRILLDTLPDTCDVFVLDSLNYLLDDFGAPISDFNWTTTGVPANHNGPILPQVVFSPGNHTITLAVTNECGITSESISFVVDPLPNVVAGPDQTICNNDTVFLDGSPKPGFWAGSGIQQDSVFVPDTLGTYELIYTFDSPSCFAYDTVYITVIDTPTVAAMPDIALCEDSTATISLTSNPPGGTWSGPNLINGNEFVADTAGTFVFTYTFVDSIGCPGRDQVVVIVNPEPVVDIMADTALFCLTNIPQPLPPATPPGGTWSGPGITDPINGLFNPDSLGGPDTVMLDYTFVSDSGCVNTDSLVVVVVVADSVTAGPGNTQCWNIGLDTLSGNSPSNGVWSGGSWVVDPNVGVINTLLMTPGPNQLIYTFAPGTSCETSDTIFYNILDTLAVEAGPDEILCESTPVQFLTGFSPAGGTWSGLGILNATTGEFDPNLVPIGGSTQLTYEVVHPNGCVSRDLKTVLVDSLPTVAFQVDSAACTGDPVFFNNQ